MMRRVSDLGKGRTANKLRAYGRSAFQVAKGARTKAAIPAAFKEFGITTNPVAETSADESQNRPDKRPLSAAELKLYWKLIDADTSASAIALRLHLLTGAQRIEQFVRLKSSDIHEKHIVLYDGKGRPGRPPRHHLVPLTASAKKNLALLQVAGEFAFTTQSGKTHIANTTLSGLAIKAVGTRIASFQLKRVRSAVETYLASAGIPSDVRGRLQSHGISGVQARHYDGHDYFREKLLALKKLEGFLSS